MQGVNNTMAYPNAANDTMNREDMAMDHSKMGCGGMRQSSMGNGMHMYFYVSNEATILFDSWKTSTAAGMFGSCVAIIVLAALYEGLKVFRERLFYAVDANKIDNQKAKPQPVAADDFYVGTEQPSAKSNSSTGSKMFRMVHIMQTVLHMIQIGISYVLMLIFMTYNVWLCLAVVGGAGLGYFLFGWMKTHFMNAGENCH